ncbi:MAG: diphthamide synthesis protein [Nanoarchaeota archaeon]|nr:diphthamide synthesis protein [Nanoarchaeota archaeon]
MNYTIANLEKDYELELEKIISGINESKAETILLQLPDGLKPWGSALVDYIEEETKTKVSIWLGACFGACDLPDSDADLVIQFGHAPWKK